MLLESLEMAEFFVIDWFCRLSAFVQRKMTRGEFIYFILYIDGSKGLSRWVGRVTINKEGMHLTLVHPFLFFHWSVTLLVEDSFPVR